MARLEADIHAREITAQLAVRVRARLASVLLRLGAWTAGTRIEMELVPAHEVRRLDLEWRSILVVRYDAILGAVERNAMSDHFRRVLDDADRSDVKLLITDRTVSLEVLEPPRSQAGYQPASGGGAPPDPPNEGSAGRRS